jgi:hypothetical protein
VVGRCGAQEMLKGLLKAAAVIDLLKMGSRATRTRENSHYRQAFRFLVLRHPEESRRPLTAKVRRLRIGVRLYGNYGIGKRKADPERSAAAAVVFCRPGILSVLFHNPSHLLKLNSLTVNSSINTLAPIRVVLPAYNEEKDLSRLLDRLQASVDAVVRQYEMIVVEEGSKGRTAEIAEDAALRMPMLLVRHAVNQGLGRAMQTGLTVAA